MSRLWERVKGMSCLICGADYTEAAHVQPTGRGYGDRLPNGDGNLVPLCPGHHDEADGRCIGHGGRAQFEAEYGVDLRAEARKLAAEVRR